MILRETEEFGNRLLLFPNSIASDCFGFEISRSLASVSAEFFSCEQFSFRILQFHGRLLASLDEFFFVLARSLFAD